MSGEKRIKCPKCGNKYIAWRLFESFNCPHCVKVVDSEEELLKIFGEETGEEFQEELIKRMVESEKLLDQKSPRIFVTRVNEAKHEETNNSDKEDT